MSRVALLVGEWLFAGEVMAVSLDVVVADEFVVFLDGLSTSLTQGGHRVVGAITQLASLEQAVRAQQPDVCLLEPLLEAGKGIEAIAAVADWSQATKVVALTADPSPDTLRAALDAGAAAYVHKSRPIAVVLDVLQRVSADEIVIEGSFTRPAGSGSQASRVKRLALYLTPRETECLALLVRGLDTGAMSSALGVSITTVRTHVRAVLAKLGVHSRLEAVALASRYRLIEPFEK